MTILGVNGPIEASAQVAPFEYLCFDWSLGAKPNVCIDRLTLRNRAAVVSNPFAFYENLKVSAEDAAQEVDDSSFSIIVNFSSPAKTAQVQKLLRSNKRLVAAAQLADLHAPLSQQIEWLKCAVLMGVEGSFCGVLGPCTGPGLEAYAKAQAATGAPLVLLVEEVTEALRLLNDAGADLRKVVFLNLKGDEIKRVIEETRALLGFTSPAPETEIVQTESPLRGVSPSELRSLVELVPTDRLLLSPGLCLRSHFRNYGGFGLARNDMVTVNGATFLDFQWNPPKVEVMVEKQIWTCHMCGSSGDDDVRNYTKMGFTYCSMTCLAKHRVSGFK